MPVAVSCTDSISNTYTHLTSMRVRATRNPSEYADGTNVEVFWCASSSGSMSQVLSPPGISCPGDPTGANYIRVDWDEETYNRVVWAVRFRGHDGPPFQIQHYGDNDVSVMESNEIMAPIPLPTWTFARTGGLVLSVMFAEPAADYSEPESGGAGFSPTSPFGGLYGTSWSGAPYSDNNTSITVTNYDPPSSGTTTGIQPGLTHRTNVNALPVYNAWKASVVFGMDRAAAAGSLDRRYAQLLGRTCLDDVGWTWVRGLIPGHAVPFFNFDIATGDGILVFAGAPDTLDITPPPPDTVAGNYAYYHNGEWHIHKDIV